MYQLNVLTPERKMITDLEVDEVLLPGSEGQLGILPGHAPLVTSLGIGAVTFREKGQSKYQTVVVSWGYAEVHPDGVVVLAETADSLEEIDRARAEAALKKAQDALADPLVEPDQITHFQHQMKKALAHLEALEKTSQTTH